MSFHGGQTFVFGEQPAASKWQWLWDNDDALANGTGISDAAIAKRHMYSGALLQEVAISLTAAVTTTTVLPFDDTLPQSGEGGLGLSLAITPFATTSVLEISAGGFTSPSVSDWYTNALFKDADANALEARAAFPAAAGGGGPLHMNHRRVSGTVSAITFKLRYGCNAAATTTFGGQGGTRKFGGAGTGAMIIREIKA